MNKKVSSNEKARSKNKKNDDFLVVGIGASAGGIKALKELFAELPDDTGMAFVVILHLSKDFESNLAELIQRETKLHVEQVTEPARVEPNKVYVIPPAKHLEMVDGIISLKEPESVKGRRVPIDHFFRSLAEVYGKRAVCIILSGTGTDGTVGLKHIKGRDGFAIVQEPRDAEYDGMPRSAIETKIVDVVLPISEMPEKLLFVRDSTEKFRLTNGRDGEVASEIKNIKKLNDVLAVLRVRTGHDFSNYKQPTLIRRLVRHLQIHETDDLQEYLEILRNKPDEILSLLKNLLINVTNFFRDKEAFEILEKRVIPNLFEGKTSEHTLLVWSAGCSTGEEAYSLAILLSEFAVNLSNPPKIQIFGSDVDDDAIAEAREGRFTEAIVADVSPERLRQFFIREDDTYRIRKPIREMILFAPHNILRDPPFSRIDLISCRNVLIYLNRETQEKVLQILHFALRNNGYLFLGSSESADNFPNNFSPIDKKHRIYQSRPSSSGWKPPPTMPNRGLWTPTSHHMSTEMRQNLYSFGELHHRLIEQYAPPSVLVNEEGDILHLSENAGRFLRFIDGEPTANLLKVVHPSLLPDVRAALFAAKQEDKIIESKKINVQINGEEIIIHLIVRPVKMPEAAALVIFDVNKNDPEIKNKEQVIVAGDEAMESVVRQMEDELRQTKDQLRNTIEQYETSVEELKASTEELQAMNEELRSATEELETGKEELQSVNEELTTINIELKEKIEEVSLANSDMQNLIKSTDIATIFLDRKLQVKRFTPRATEIFNLIPGDLGRPFSHITHRLTPDHFEQDAEAVLNSLQPSQREVRSSEGRFYIARFSPYRTVEDNIDGVVVLFIDVTERKQAEEALRQSEEQFRAIFGQILGGIAEIDLEGKYTLVNERYLEITGYSNRELLKMRMPEIIHPAESKSFQKLFGQLAEGGKSFEVENRFIRRDGSEIWVYNSVSPLFDADGRPKGAANVSIDITERKMAEKDLRESEARLKAITNLVPDLLWSTNEKGAIDWFNDRWFEYTGQKIENATGDGWLEVIHPDDRENSLRQTILAHERGESMHQIHRMRNVMGEYRWFLVRSEPLIDEQGKVLRWFGAATDIHEQRHMLEVVRESEERMRIALDAAEMGTWEWDLESGQLIWNERHYKLYGMKPGKKTLKTKDLFKKIHPVDREKVREEIDKAVKNKTVLEIEFCTELDNGSKRWLRSYGRITDEMDGKPVKMAGVTFDITLRKHAEEKLHKALESLQLATDAAELGTWDWNLMTGEVVWNDRHFRILGIKPRKSHVEVDEFFKRLHPDDRERVSEQIRKSIEEKTIFMSEFRIIKKDGTIRWVSGYGKVVEEKNGQATRMSGVLVDITERKKSEDVIRETEERFKNVANSAPVKIWISDSSKNYIWFNNRWLGFTGKAIEQETGDGWTEGIHPKDLEHWREGFDSAFEARDPFSIEYRLRRSDGKYRWLLDNGIPRFSQNGEFLGYIGSCIDITPRKIAEEHLRLSEERLRLILESVQDYAIFTTDINGLITRWNSGAEKIFGYTESEVIGQNAEFIFTPEDRKNGVPELEMKTALEHGRAEDERWHVRKDGSRFYVSGVTTRLSDGELEGFVKIARDLTEERELSEKLQRYRDELEVKVKERTRELKRANKNLKNENQQRRLVERDRIQLLEQLVTTQEDERRRIARDIHDHLGQQITSLRLKLDLIRGMCDDEILCGHIEDTQEISRRIDSDIDFLAWELRPSALDDIGLSAALSKFIKEWSDHFKIPADFKSSNMGDYRLAPEAETNLYRIAQEALNNIAKHARAKRVDIMLERRDHSAVLVIEDDGVGFEPQTLTAAGKSEKTMGLISMRERALLVGGNLEIESEPGKGTTLFIRVPFNKNRKEEK